jgi:hypothetical protein
VLLTTAGAKMRDRHPVDGGHDLDALLQRRVVGGMGAGIADVGPAHRQEISLRVEGEFRGHREVTGLVVAQERLVTVAGPFDRLCEAPRRPRDQGELRIDHPAGAEIAADLAHDDAHIVRRHRENGGEVVLEPPHPAAAGIERCAAGIGVECGDRGARLHGHAGDALDPGVEFHHMGGAGEGRRGAGGVAEFAVDHDVGVGFVEQARCIGMGRLARVGDRGQHLVVDLDQFGAILGGGDAPRHHHGHGLADEANFVGRQRIMRRRESLEAVAALERNFGGML